MTDSPRSSKILLDCGSSGANGWSSISKFMVCPQLYFWNERMRALHGEGAGIGNEAPLVRGSIGHAGLAHLYTRVKLAQEGLGHDDYYSPIEAMALVAQKAGDLGTEMLPIAARVVKAYSRRYATERNRIVAVERLVTTEFHGWPYTARIDLEFEDRAEKVWIVDHKIVHRLEGKVYRRYVMSGQVLGLTHIGARTYGKRFGGVLINLLGVNPRAFDRVPPDPAPWILGRFPEIVARAREGIERVRAELKRDPEYVIPACPSEYTCFPYNHPCPMFEACRWGKTVIGERRGTAGVIEENGVVKLATPSSPVDILGAGS
jgi:hypothetical protein